MILERNFKRHPLDKIWYHPPNINIRLLEDVNYKEHDQDLLVVNIMQLIFSSFWNDSIVHNKIDNDYKISCLMRNDREATVVVYYKNKPFGSCKFDWYSEEDVILKPKKASDELYKLVPGKHWKKFRKLLKANLTEYDSYFN